MQALLSVELYCWFSKFVLAKKNNINDVQISYRKLFNLDSQQKIT